MAKPANTDAADTGPYQVVARRFRPTRFDEVVGQAAVVKSLESALRSGQIPHAFLFSGSRGVGKTTLARVLSRALNCENGPTPTPCDTCKSCGAILGGSSADVVEIDAASNNGVDDVRELRERVGLASMGSRYKVYILDEVHMLSKAAFNAFLKTLEEPPPNVVFVLATTELHKVPETIRSRCQVYLFRRMDDGDITHRLRAICAAEGVAIPDEVLDDIAAASCGGMRDAEGALERLLPVAREQELDLAAYRSLAHRMGFESVADAVTGLLQGDASAALHFAAGVAESGADEREALGEVLELVRAVLMLRVDGEDSQLVSHDGRSRERLQQLAAAAELHRLEAMIHAGLQGRERMRRVEDRRLVLELALLAMARAGTLPQLAELLERLRGGGELPAVAPAPGPASTASRPASTASRPAVGSGDLRSRLLAHLEKTEKRLVPTLEQCELTGPEPGDTVHIRLQGESKFHGDRLASDGIQRTLREALCEVVGRRVSLIVGSAGPAAEPAPAASRGDGGRAVPPTGAPAGGGSSRKPPGPSVQKVMERFDGQIVDDDDAEDLQRR